jgi:COMPASS component SWD3
LERHREFDKRIKYVCVDRQCTHEFRALCEDCYRELHNGHRVIDLIEAEKLGYQLHSARLSKLKTHITKLNDMLQHSVKTIKSTLKQLQLQFNRLIQEEIELL